MGPPRTCEPVEFRVLGPFDVYLDGRPVNIGSAKQRLLLATLVLNLNTSVSAERLVDVLWGEAPPASVESTLRSLVSRLRRALEEFKADGVELRGTSTGYVLTAAADTVDAYRFDRLAATGRELLARGDAGRAAETLARALTFWRGAALGEFAGQDFARPEAARLDEARLGVVEDLADAELALGRPGDAITRLEAHLAEHPLRERAWSQLMLALYRVGRQADALRAYQQVRKMEGAGYRSTSVTWSS